MFEEKTDNNRENLRNNVFKENVSFNFQFESDTSVWNKQKNFVAFFNCMRIVDVKKNEKDLFTKLNSSYLNYLMTHRKGYLSYFYWNHL